MPAARFMRAATLFLPPTFHDDAMPAAVFATLFDYAAPRCHFHEADDTPFLRRGPPLRAFARLHFVTSSFTRKYACYDRLFQKRCRRCPLYFRHFYMAMSEITYASVYAARER